MANKKKLWFNEANVIHPSEEETRWFYPDKLGYIKNDNLIEWIITEFKKVEKTEDELQLIVGCDSQPRGILTRFASVVCLYNVGKGGNYFYTINYKNSRKYKDNPKLRIFDEVHLAVEFAQDIFDKTGFVPTIDIDASPKEKKHYTSDISDSLMGYVRSFGFNPRIKPNPIASCVGDRHSK